MRVSIFFIYKKVVELVLEIREKKTNIIVASKKLFDTQTTLANVNESLDSSHKTIEELERSLSEALNS